VIAKDDKGRRDFGGDPFPLLLIRKEGAKVEIRNLQTATETE
jgi:hypothetical protein